MQCRDALFVTDPHVDRESLITAKGTRVPSTCEWIRNDVKYRAWLNGGSHGDSGSTNDIRLLWISGGPGKGKTMLSIFLTEELEKHAAHQENTDLIFFFCSAQNEKHNTALAVLRGLLHQILTKRPQLSKHALRHFEPPERKQQTLSSLEALWIIFVEVITDVDFGTVFCVLDGLDECEESIRKGLVSRLVTLLNGQNSSTQNMFKLAIISREMPGLKNCPRVRLDPDNDERVSSDIELFISARMSDLSEIEGFNGELQASVQKELLDRAEGTFLWVGFAIHELSQKRTCSEVLKALRGLPRGLPAIYSRMLLQIPEEQRETSCNILRWVALAVRPLSLQELAAATSIQSPFPTQITEEQAIRDAIFYCKPLLQEQETRKVEGNHLIPGDYHVWRQKQKEIGFIHQSARDYLLRKERDNNKILEEFRIEPENANLEITITCLDCITQSGLWHLSSDSLANFKLKKSHLLDYSVLHWPEHARGCLAQDAALLDTLKRFIYNEPSIRTYWWAKYTTLKYMYFPSDIPVLHLTCYLGIASLVEAELVLEGGDTEFGEYINLEDKRGNTPLFLATLARSQDIVRILIDKGAKVNVKNMENRTPLHIAARVGDIEILRLLISKGAAVNARDFHGEAPLHLAVRVGNEIIVDLLLDAGANIEARGQSGNTSLHGAVETRNMAMVRLLLDKGADIEAKTRHKGRPLHVAVSTRSTVISQLLLDRGANLEPKNRAGETPLHEASKGGEEAMVQLLLDRGADVGAKTTKGKQARDLALSKKHMALVRLLDNAKKTKPVEEKSSKVVTKEEIQVQN